MNWYKKATRGRYEGQLQGDEYRPGDTSLTEIIDDNELIEGEFVRVLNKLIKEGRWDEVEKYTDKLRQEGHSRNRINSMITRALHGVRL